MHRTWVVSTRAGRVAAAAAAMAVLAGCGVADADGDPAADPDPDGTQVLVSFYPLEWVASRVAGDRAQVGSLTPAGAEAHDLELSPRDVAALSEADLLVYLSGFQPAVDDAVASAGGAAMLDAAGSASLAGTDPHFWLDPRRLADVGYAVTGELSRLDPGGASTYEANGAALRADLEALDGEMESGLADCASRSLVTSHEAFGYLADRYGFTQLGISGLAPEDGASPGQLAEVTDFVRANDVTTIYFETLVSPETAQAVADETGARTATLDPIEGLTDESAGQDYLEVMRANLAVLQRGQSCG